MFSAGTRSHRPQVAQDTKTGSFFRDSTDFSTGTPSSAIYLRLCTKNVSYYLPKGGKDLQRIPQSAAFYITTRCEQRLETMG